MNQEKKMDNEIRHKLEEDLKFYSEFRTRLQLLMKEFEETEDLTIQYHKITGKIELLKQLLDIFKTNQKEKSK